jgi:LEA14-like dessication related protein
MSARRRRRSRQTQERELTMLTGTGRIAATLAAVALLAGCATHFEKPDIHVVSVGVKTMTKEAQELRVRLKVVNPNTIALPIEGINYTVLVNGESFARGETTESITVPARGASDVEVPVVLDLKGGLGGVLTLGTLLSGGIDYRVSGNVRTGITFFRNIPFDEKGKFGLP